MGAFKSINLVGDLIVFRNSNHYISADDSGWSSTSQTLRDSGSETHLGLEYITASLFVDHCHALQWSIPQDVLPNVQMIH